jgi:hypothetical protein
VTQTISILYVLIAYKEFVHRLAGLVSVFVKPTSIILKTQDKFFTIAHLARIRYIIFFHVQLMALPNFVVIVFPIMSYFRIKTISVWQTKLCLHEPTMPQIELAFFFGKGR